MVRRQRGEITADGSRLREGAAAFRLWKRPDRKASPKYGSDESATGKPGAGNKMADRVRRDCRIKLGLDRFSVRHLDRHGRMLGAWIDGTAGTRTSRRRIPIRRRALPEQARVRGDEAASARFYHIIYAPPNAPCCALRMLPSAAPRLESHSVLFSNE